MHPSPNTFQNSTNYDINNNPIFSPSDESNHYFRQPDNLFDDTFQFNNIFDQNSDDNLLFSNFPYLSTEAPNLNIPNEGMTTTAATRMPANPEIRINTIPLVFKIEKVKKKFIGRRNRDIAYLYEAEHTKFEKKNMLTRIKKASYNNFLKNSNKNIKDSKDEEIKKREIELKKVDNSLIEVSSKNDNLKLIKKKMKDILSGPLSNNYKKIDKNYNKKAIEFILRGKDEKLISNLNISFEDVIRIYAGDLKDKNFDGFKTIEDDVKEMEDSLKDHPELELEEMEYIKTYIEYAKNYKKTYMNIKGRSSKKKKIN